MGEGNAMSKHVLIMEALRGVEEQLANLGQLEVELREGTSAVMEKPPADPKGVPPTSLAEFLETTAERVSVIAERIAKIKANMREMLL